MGTLYKKQVPLRMTIVIDWEDRVDIYRDAIEGDGIEASVITHTELVNAMNKGALSFANEFFDEDMVQSVVVETREVEGEENSGEDYVLSEWSAPPTKKKS